MKRTHQMVEKALVEELLKGNPQPGCHLQSERELAARFSVSRATVREALLRLQRSGWITVQQRHPTVVNDFWTSGNLELLSSITKNSEPFPWDLTLHLLEMRAQFAPDYARRAVENDAPRLTEYLGRASKVRNSSSNMAKYDEELHLTMAVLSGNKLYPLMMNSLSELFSRVKAELFVDEEHRNQARLFYKELLESAGARNPDRAEVLTRTEMNKRLERFRQRMAAC